MKNLLLLLFCLQASFFLNAQTKHALIVGVGKYPERTNGPKWSNLSSGNDVILVRDMLIGQGFDSVNIHQLIDEEATVSNLMMELDRMLLNIQSGDIFYLHYSGHGQQVADLNASDYPHLKYIQKDEDDGFDEALVLYNAPQEYFDGYDFSEHFIDDQMDYYVSKIEDKIGKDGHLVVVLDACHSGTGTRGKEPTRKRGSSTKCVPNGFKRTYNDVDEKNYDIQGSVGNGIKAVFMGCKNDEVNYEISIQGKGYGSLTYSLVQAINSLQSAASYKNVFDIVYGKLLINSAGKQHAQELFDEPTSLFFGGKTVPASLFYSLSRAVSGVAVVRAGLVHGLSVGDSLAFYPVGETKVDNKGYYTKGIVQEVMGSTCIVSIDIDKKQIGLKDFSLFKAKRIYEVILGQKIYVEISENVSKENVKLLKDKLKNEKNIFLVLGKNETPNYYISENENRQIRIEMPITGNSYRNMRWLTPQKDGELDSLRDYLRTALKIDYFINLELYDQSIDLDIGLQQISDSIVKIKLSKFIKSWKEHPNLKGLEFDLKNNSSDEVFVHAVYISNNKIIQEIDINWREGGDKYVRLIPGYSLKKTQLNPIFTECTDHVDCGLDRIYFFASYEKLDFSIVEQMSMSLGTTRGSDDPFIKLISNGSDGKNQSAAKASGVRIYKYELDFNK